MESGIRKPFLFPKLRDDSELGIGSDHLILLVDRRNQIRLLLQAEGSQQLDIVRNVVGSIGHGIRGGVHGEDILQFLFFRSPIGFGVLQRILVAFIHRVEFALGKVEPQVHSAGEVFVGRLDIGYLVHLGADSDAAVRQGRILFLPVGIDKGLLEIRGSIIGFVILHFGDGRCPVP